MAQPLATVVCEYREAAAAGTPVGEPDVVEAEDAAPLQALDEMEGLADALAEGR